MIAVASDYQESKNVDQAGANVLPNTTFRSLRLRAVAGPTVTWLMPKAAGLRRQGDRPVRHRRAPRTALALGDVLRRAATDREGHAGGSRGSTPRRGGRAKAARGKHVLRAVATDRRGATATAKRVVRVCRR